MERDLFAFQSVRVAGTVPFFVVVMGDVQRTAQSISQTTILNPSCDPSPSNRD
ncbi:MAG: hypothetical protein Q7U34_07590 [Anaerolineales bacterium]|nr:hypothetical protein [Anaerolineales bacterium]